MKEKRLFLGISVVALTIGVISFAALMTNGKKILTKADPLTDYQQTLTFTAENMPGENGSVTINGNTFDYTNVGHNGNHMIFATGSTLTFRSMAGETLSSQGMYGGGFKSIGFTAYGDCNFTFTLNGDDNLVADALDGETIEYPFGSPYFEIEITDGSFTTTALNIKYECVAPVASQKLLLIGASTTIDTDYTPGQQYADLLDSLGGGVATYSVVKSGTYTAKQILNTSKYTKSLTDALAADNFDTIIVQISRRTTKNSDPLIRSSEKEAIKTLVDTYLAAETSKNNIYIMAPKGESNMTMFDYSDSPEYSKNSEKDTATMLEQCDYYEELATEFAQYAGVKPMYYSSCYGEYAGGYSQTSGGVKFLHAAVFYCTFFNRMVPVCSTFTGGASSTAVEILRDISYRHCVTQ